MNHIIDQFDPDSGTVPCGGRFSCARYCHPGPTFFRWMFSYQGKIRITAPAMVKDAYRAMLLAAVEKL